MIQIQRREQRQGQAMTEFVIWSFVLLTMISGIIMFGRATNLKLHCHLAARYSASAHAVKNDTDLDDNVIDTRSKDYYPLQDDYEGQWQRMDPASGFDASDSSGSGPSGSGMDVFGAMNGMFNMASNTHGWQVTAKWNPNGILDDALPDGTAVRSVYFVSGGTWDKKQQRGDLMIMTVKGMLMAWSLAVLN